MFNPSLQACICTLLLASGVATAQNCDGKLQCKLLANSGASRDFTMPLIPPGTVHREVEEVRLTVSVSDQYHRPVRGLKAEDFLVHDNEQTVRVRSSPDGDVRLRIGLLVDWSGSLEKKFDFQRRSATRFVARVLRPHIDEGFIIGFTTQAVVAQVPTTDIGKLIAAVHPLKPALTALYDAIVDACDVQKQPIFGADQPMRRAILVLSDGNDTDSYHTLEDAVAAAQRSETAIYAISMHRGRRSEGDLVLQHMAQETGGEAFAVSNETGLDNAFQAIEGDLRGGYLLSFKPANLEHDGRYHRLAVIPLDRRLRVLARSGYFAPNN